MGKYSADQDFMKTVPGLFDGHVLPVPEKHRNWKPEDPPSLDGVDEIELDFETDGLRWHEGHRPVGVAVGWRGGRRYLPFRHAGGNLPEERVKEWARRELRGKKIRGLHIKFDGHMSREWGVDLEEQGNVLSDVGHYAALLDDHRREFSLEALSQSELNEGKIQGLDLTRMKEYHAADVADYAKRDVELPRLLAERYLPRIRAEGLQKVLDLEERVIFPVMHMEKNGAPINEELLDKWLNRTEQYFGKIYLDIQREYGVKLNPKSQDSMIELFRKIKQPIPIDAKTRSPTFRDEVLKRLEDQHPAIFQARRAKKLRDLRSKLKKYRLESNGTGLIHYALHQLRGDRDQGAGTVTGRFSSSGFRTGKLQDGVNIQQVMSVGRQRVAWGYDENDSSHDLEIFIMRTLFVPRPHRLWLSADAKQIEYRLFAHYANSPKILRAYENNPNVDFHNLVMSMIKAILPSITRKRAKDINFAKIYGAGLKKIALMLGMTVQEAEVFVEAYDDMFPEVPVLLERAIRAAEDRGYVRTLLGRRSRFPRNCTCPACWKGPRIHKALNSVIQGGAADINKMKIVELHDAREETGMLMYFTVHDEVDGDVEDEEAARIVEEILNRQTVEFEDGSGLRVPILWDVATGNDWRECA